ncbi:hypothetical protein M885DRAFT_591836 [Pelagophyceae sp. CCMP2097]|nr:hypothetical protein M885DRAFT_591836 [Pelagophyceae sp. CCMP2097]
MRQQLLRASLFYACLWVESANAHAAFVLDSQNQLLPVRYEDLKSDTASKLRKILEFLGAPIDEARISCAVEMTRSDKAARRIKQVTAQQLFAKYPGIACQAWAALTRDRAANLLLTMLDYRNNAVSNATVCAAAVAEAPFAGCAVAKQQKPRFKYY